ncbi:uncharacterized protein LOC116849002 [Odontomachus brunneus]|uniref:uncharacterized protein LOC116849002 n=1 Tax=Odontomachus brunneus TaxID=486640 RepID=UPI0013F23133|nr:uncharacterized protein LOC116849002 [Odontomachus brunneus]
MPTDGTGGPGLAVVAGDVLALRGTGLAAAETWALLCQAAQALQDLFLSNGGVVGGSRTGPVVTPHTLELTPRGRVLLQLAPPETARAYLPPEYRPGRVYSDTDSEKMWMYSLGRALLDTTPRVAALMGTVSVSPSSALQSVLAAMTEPDPRRRASLMNLLDVISEYCRTRLQTKPFTHIVMDMYQEVLGSPQYAVRTRAIYYQLNTLHSTRNIIDQSNHQKIYGQHYHHRHHHQAQRRQQDHVQPVNGQPPSFQHHQTRLLQHSSAAQSHNQQQDPAQHSVHQFRALQQQQEHTQQQQQQQPPPPLPPPKNHRHHHHHMKEARFRTQSRNSQSHPNLTSLCGPVQQQQQPPQQQHHQEATLSACRVQFQSQLDIQNGSRSIGPAATHHQRRHHHSRTYSQPVYTRLQHTRSSGNLPTTTNAANGGNPGGDVYNDPIYALPVKPFLSSQDVRVNGLSAKTPAATRRGDDIYGGSSSISRHPSNTGCSQPDEASQTNERLCEDIYGRAPSGRMCLQRQHSNPQLPSRTQADEDFKRLSQPSVATTEPRCTDVVARKEEQTTRQQNPVSSMRLRGIQGPPKPPRIITTLRKAALSDSECNSQTEPPAKPPRIIVRNGPRARRGKAVQRAPSRLYRTVGGPMRCFNKAQCVGPEFVVRANQPPKTLCVGQVKAGNSGRIVVIMLTGQRVEVTCDPQKVTAGDLFQAIVQAESLDENFTLGLAVLLAGDFAMLPLDTKLNKVAPPGWLSSGKSKSLLGLPTSFMLYLRLRFFLPSLRGIRSWISKHLLYLQIRRCILEQQLVCPYPELINLTGLALQAEFGNYNVDEHGCGDYFLLEHYVPESLIMNADRHQSQPCVEANALRAQLHRAHHDRRGLDSNKAEEMFITHAQSLPDYGSHYYIATVDSKELEKLMAQQRKSKTNIDKRAGNAALSQDSTKDAYRSEKTSVPRESRIGIARLGPRENAPMIPYTETGDIYAGQKCKLHRDEMCNKHNHVINNNNNNNVNGNNNKNSKTGKRKTESNVWLAIHAQGLKLLERGGEPRERTELAHFPWRDVQTLSYSKSCLVVYSKLNGKRCKFKLRMDHRKSYFAFKLTSLHHQFFLRLRSELTSLQGLAKDFGVPLITESKTTPSKSKIGEGKTKITIANTVMVQQRMNYPMQLEEYQNKENENPQKDANAPAAKDVGREPGFYSPEEDVLYAQVNVRLEPEGESRDTEEESDRGLTTPEILLDSKETKSEHGKLYGCTVLDSEAETECTYSLPKAISNNINQLDKPNNPEELYAAINKVRLSGKNEFSAPEEVWKASDVKKTLHKMKTSSLPNYGTPRQSGGFRTPSLPRRLGVKMGTRAIYSSLAQKDTALTDDMESLSVKSDTESSIQSLSARSVESPMPEAYVLNADIRTDDETFRVPEDESMSASLMARLEELSFAEERILHTINLERGHGGSIGLQVTEGNDGGVYVQAVSVGGSADMAGNVNKGDRIVAINKQNLLNLRYEDALKMLQSSSETIELVLSKAVTRKNAESRDEQDQAPADNSYLHDIRFDVSSEAETSSVTNKWIVQKTTDVASVQNTSSAYSSAASSAMGNHNANSLYMTDLVDNNTVKSANNGSSTEPPVPPRRTKRKIQTAPIAMSIPNSAPVRETTSDTRPQQKRPPSLPPPPEKCRRNKSRPTETCQPQCDTASCPTAESVASEYHQRDSHIDIVAGVIEAKSPRSRDTISTREKSTGDANDDPIPGSTATSRVPFLSVDVASTRKPLDKYPPLFFTTRDFQDVMPATWKRENTADAPSNAAPDESPDPREQVSSATFTLDDGDDNDDEDVCFRVTTTNLPFERCLERWKSPFDDEFAMRFEDYRFEGNTDGNARINDRRPLAHDISDSNEDSDCRLGAKVRFVIEPPSSAILEFDTDVKSAVQCGSSRNCKPIFEEEPDNRKCSVTSSLELAETRDERVDGTDRENNPQGKPCSPSTDESNVAVRENSPPTPADARKTVELSPRCDDEYNNVNREEIHKEDFNSISWNKRVSRENYRVGEEKIMPPETAIMREGNAEKQADQMLDASSKITGNTYRATAKSSATARGTEETKITLKKAERKEEVPLTKANDDIREKPIAKNEKLLIDESPRNVLNRLDGNNRYLDDSCDGRIFVDDLARRGSLGSEKTRRSPIDENKETSGCWNPENNREQISPSDGIFAESVSVKVRRNSFLETMLTDYSTDHAIIDSMIPSSSTDEEVSVPHELRNKTREWSIEIARGSARSRGSNGVTKVDVENPDISKNSKKTKGKTAVVSVGDVKLTQSENKSAGEAKNDVLNELLCNFNSIKLKTVSPETKGTAKTQTGDDESLALPVAIDRIADGRLDAGFQTRVRERSWDEARGVLSARTISTEADGKATIAGEVAKEEVSADTQIKGPSRDLKGDTRDPKGDTRDPAFGEEIARCNTTETTRLEVASRGVEIARDTCTKTKLDKESPGVKSNEIRAKASTGDTSEGAEGANWEVRSRRSRDVCAPKTILKKPNAECERRASEFQKRIPIGAPTTMNKIFDSRELEAITYTSRGSSLEGGEVRGGATSRVTHGRGDEKKTDEEVIADDVADVERRLASRPALALENSGDKCAIARKITTSATPCNNNDNNRAVTPVAVSNDQSPRDVVTITPGKVRSFVKYYEIRGDATTEIHSKINGSERVARRKSTRSPPETAPTVAARSSQRPEVTTARKETGEGESLLRSHGEVDLLTFVTSRVPVDLHSLLADGETTRTESMVTKERERNDVSDRETRAQHTRASVKKSVQFLGGFTVIHSRSFDESAGTAADYHASSSRKRRAPGRPPSRDSDVRQGLVREIAKSDKLPDTEESSFQRREVAAQVHAVAGHEENSGINRFVTKPETPQLVFYCTV